ncbi:MAG TPA: MFS transporter [Burkholderiales bacterium]|nr:MFS transporter [Burkholderiales bacterium]
MLSKPTQVVVALGLAQTLAWGSTYYLPAILANAMAAELGLASVWVFIAFSSGLLIAAFLGPASGRLIDSYGGRRVLAGSSLVFAAGLAMLGTSSGIGSLFAGWLVIGIGMSAGLYEAAFSTLAGIYGRDARRAITGITLIAGFASTVCWPLSAYMDITIGWRATCYVWAAAHLAIGLPINLLLPAARPAEKAAHAAAPSAAGQGRLVVMAGLSFVFAATWFCSTAMAAHLPRLLQEAGASLPAAIAAAALVGPAQVAARLLEFGFMRHVHPIVSARIASLAHPVGAAGLLAVGSPGATFFTVTHGAGNGVMTIAIGTLPLVLFGATGYGLRQGMLMVPARLLQSGAPFIFDVLLSRYGTAALAVTAALGIASFLVLTALPARQ